MLRRMAFHSFLAQSALTRRDYFLPPLRFRPPISVYALVLEHGSKGRIDSAER
jgi:hypothetical protein